MLRQLCGLAAAVSLLRPTVVLHAALQRSRAILVDDSHGGSDIKNEYNFGSATLGRLLSEKGWKVDGTKGLEKFNPSVGLTPAILADFDLLVFNGRFAGPDFPFSEPEIAAIEDWVRKGHSLLVVGASGHLGKGQTNETFNPVLKPFGLSFIEGQFTGTTQTTKLKHSHPIMRGLNQFRVISGAAVKGNSPEGQIAWVDRDSVLDAVEVGSGRVVAFGGGTAFMGQAINSNVIKYNTPQIIAPNVTLLLNVVRWLLREDGRDGSSGHL
jgi:hypothetical protein